MTKKARETKSESGNGGTGEDYAGVRKLRCAQDQETGIETVCENNRSSRMRKLLAVSLALSLEQIRQASGREAVDEVLKILHREEFSLRDFKDMVKSSQDCERVKDKFIEENKHYLTWHV